MPTVMISVNVTKYCPRVSLVKLQCGAISPEFQNKEQFIMSMKCGWDVVRRWRCLKPKTWVKDEVPKQNRAFKDHLYSQGCSCNWCKLKTKALLFSRQCKILDSRLNVRLQIRTSKAKTALGLALHIHRVTWHTILPLPRGGNSKGEGGVGDGKGWGTRGVLGGRALYRGERQLSQNGEKRGQLVSKSPVQPSWPQGRIPLWLDPFWPFPPNLCAQWHSSATGSGRSGGGKGEGSGESPGHSSRLPSTLSTNFLIRTSSGTAHGTLHQAGPHVCVGASGGSPDIDSQAPDDLSPPFTYFLISALNLRYPSLRLPCSPSCPLPCPLPTFARRWWLPRLPPLLFIPSQSSTLIMDSIKQLKLPPNELLL